jgi:hypothetical protein
MGWIGAGRAARVNASVSFPPNEEDPSGGGTGPRVDHIAGQLDGRPHLWSLSWGNAKVT